MPLTPTLCVLPALTAAEGEGGSFILTRKFLDGVLEYASRWPGRVVVGIDRAADDAGNLDHVAVDPHEVPFDLRWMCPADRDRTVHELVSRSTVVLATLVDKHVDLALRCRLLGVPLVYVTEYSEQTRRQIIRAETSNPMLRWRRERWTMRLERRYVNAIKTAAGVQCNGTPTFRTYRVHNPRPLLYFDTRVRARQLADRDTIERRIIDMLSGGALRLAFSGRLIRMKGADHLPRVAAELRATGVPFTLDICGAGEIEPQLKRELQRQQLSDCVRMRGVLNFATELLPMIAQSVDLFVCCHRQGDPSCTYLETLACGTPIVSYDNEAFQGIATMASIGWMARMNEPALLARRIGWLHQHRQALARSARNALRFASEHTLESTMQARIDHLLACADDPQQTLKGAAA